jgi:ABC-type transport system involved in cytochrome c biogenesis permease subunit
VTIILRFRWILVAILIAILYFTDRKGSASLDPNYVWFYVAILLFAALSGQLDRTERKLDLMAKHESAGGQLHSNG